MSAIVVRRRLKGVAGIAVVLCLVALSLAVYQKTFVSSTTIVVTSPRAGLLLDKGAAVRAAGLKVGEVRSVKLIRTGEVRITIALDPAAARTLPSNVTADIGASTVFGAKFVDLMVPKSPSGQSIQAGQVITADSVTPETNDLFASINQTITAVDPVALNRTLTAVSSALQGHGDELGSYLSDANRFVNTLNVHSPAFERAVKLSTPVLNGYNVASPDLLATARQASTTAATLADLQSQLHKSLAALSSVSMQGVNFLDLISEPLHRSMGNLQPTFTTLARFSGVLTCVLQGMGGVGHGVKIVTQSLGGSSFPGITGNTSFLPAASGYKFPQNLPKLAANETPRCFGLPIGDVMPPHYRFGDGTAGIFDGGGPATFTNPVHVYNSLVQEFFGEAGLNQLLGPTKGKP